MKKLSFFIFILSSSLSIQAQLNANHNSIRAGDVIVKQQVEFKDPREANANQIWDFSKVKLVNDEYELSYQAAPLIGDSIYVMGYTHLPKKAAKHADLIIGTEHNTMYYFYQTSDSLVLLGHENVAVKQENLQPIMNLKFPLNYGGIPSQSKYQTQGFYSGSTEIQSEGNITLFADAFGKMILPSGDTINPVLRVKTEQQVIDTSKDVVSADKGHLLRTYRWYSKGYRYPIFETVEFIDQKSDSTLFETAFYFPIQDHYYLDTDPENVALLDKLWDYTNDDYDAFKKIDLLNEDDKKLNYSVYPNPVSDILSIEYTLEQDSPVNIILATIDGRVVRNIFRKQQKGAQLEQIACSNFVTGVYLLKVVAGELVINERIIKK